MEHRENNAGQHVQSDCQAAKVGGVIHCRLTDERLGDPLTLLQISVELNGSLLEKHYHAGAAMSKIARLITAFGLFTHAHSDFM